MATFTNIPIQDLVMVLTDPPIGRVEERNRWSWGGRGISQFEGMPNTQTTRDAIQARTVELNEQFMSQHFGTPFFNRNNWRSNG